MYTMEKVMLVAGARPNFMKIAPVLREIQGRNGLNSILVHTGQHYDHKMSGSFFKELNIKEPDYNLGVGSGSHAEQTAKIMVEFEKVCLKEEPKVVIVVGDVNSTIAAGLVAKKLHIALAHIEAGLRSGDREMPEEINRLSTDAITDLFFTTEERGTENLLKEGHEKYKVHFAGHVMIDNLMYQLDKVNTQPPSEYIESVKKRLPERYITMTMHRPSNVDSKENLAGIMEAVRYAGERIPVIFPVHPRTEKQLKEFGMYNDFQDLNSGDSGIDKGCYITGPLGYNDFLYLWKDCVCTLTDSGGLQEETTALKIPCITMRENTERPVTVYTGSNVVAGCDPEIIKKYINYAVESDWKTSSVPELWDGKASTRIVEAVSNFIKLGS